MNNPAKNTACLWFNGDAEEAARFYAQTFPDSAITSVHRAPGDYPAGQEGDVLTVEFTVASADSVLTQHGTLTVSHSHALTHLSTASVRELKIPQAGLISSHSSSRFHSASS